MNTDHKLGRAEAVRDMSRVIYDEVRASSPTSSHLRTLVQLSNR